MALRDFRKRVGATTRDVAGETGLNQSTIVRIENGAKPNADSALKILRWAAGVARQKRIPKRSHLRLEDLLDSSDATSA